MRRRGETGRARRAGGAALTALFAAGLMLSAGTLSRAPFSLTARAAESNIAESDAASAVIIKEETAASPAEETQTISLLYKYDSTDTAVVRSVDQAAGTVTLCQHELGRYYTLRVDNTSMIYNRYGRPISAGLLEPGEVVDATFLHQSKHLNSLVISGAAWVKEGVRIYSIDTDRELMTIDGANYHLPGTALLLNRENGIGERIIAEELLPNDVLTVYGIDKEIYSVVVTGGHGYLRLTSAEVNGQDISGAWLNLSNKVIRRVEERMLVAAPEGDYELQIIGQGANDRRTVTIMRGQETVIDASTIHMEEPDTTEVTFLVEPEDAGAVIRVDNEEVAAGFPTYLTVGVHQLKVRAEGYLDITEYLRVGEKAATVELALERDPDAAVAASTASSADTASSSDTANTAGTGDEASTAGTSDWWYSSSGNAGTGATGNAGDASTSNAAAGSGATAVTTRTVVDASGNETTRTTLAGYEVRIEAPDGVEFYLDDSYIGVTPTSFTKVSGQHTVTLSREGYETKSYNIYIDDAQSNKTYAFPALVRSE